MAMLSLPKMSLGILVWYIDSPTNTASNQMKPYTTLTMVQHVVPSLAFSSVPQQYQREPTPVVKASERE